MESCNQFLDQLAPGLAELFEAAFVKEGELAIVQAQQVKDGHVQVSDRVNYLDGLLPDFE